MNFDVASGSGLFSSLERNKYSALSDKNGDFKLQNLGDDIDNTFYPKFFRSYDFDSTQIEWRYFVEGAFQDSLWITKGINNTIRLRPATNVYFYHPKINNDLYPFDTIRIKVYNQTDVLTNNKKRSKSFQLLPSKIHRIVITYVKNGIDKNLIIERYIPTAYIDRVEYGIILNKTNINVPE